MTEVDRGNSRCKKKSKGDVDSSSEKWPRWRCVCVTAGTRRSGGKKKLLGSCGFC